MGDVATEDRWADLPQKFKKYRTEAGLHLSTTKAFIWGPPKVGKSRLGMGFPGPKFIIDTGEAGVQYLADHESDLILTIDQPEAVVEAFEWGCAKAREGKFQTLGVDTGTLFWEATKEAGYKKLGDKEARFQDWAWIKKPTNKFLRLAQSVPANVWVTAWQQGLVLEQEGGKGMAVQTKIKKVDLARIEGKFTYIFDYLYSLDQEDDAMGRPTGKYVVMFVGGRKPEACPPAELFPGKIWKFDPKQPKTKEEVWDEVMGWLKPYKEQGGTPTIIGLDTEKAQDAERELQLELEDEMVGRVARVLAEVKDAADWARATLPLQQMLLGVSKEVKAMAQKLVDTRKSELGIGGK